ncbi:MAG: hypothetical protein JW840_03145 [Candidatus Thermoplasmatota archaeon]|nr:hypothetical protein [Candidatus Thermoplasmatota archaeon]
MKKNENIFVSLEIQKDMETKGLFLSVQFDRNAPNFFQENETITWLPTNDELHFLNEAFDLIGTTTLQMKTIEETPEADNSSGIESTDYSHRSSEIRIAPLPNDLTLEVDEEAESSRVRNRDDEEKIFIQADEKKIDEILKRKKHAVRQKNNDDSEDKALVERMLKQKKKK